MSYPDIKKEGSDIDTDIDLNIEEEEEVEDIYQDDADFLESRENLSSLTQFPTDAYNIASSTPVGTPSSSPKKTKVKEYVDKLEESIATSGKSKGKKKKAKMGRIARYKLMVERTKTEAEKTLDKATKMKTDKKATQDEIKEMIADLKAIKTNVEKDMIEVKQEVPEESEEKEYVDLEWKLKELVMKSTAGILKLKDLCEEVKPSALVAGKVTKIDVPDYHGDYVRYKPWKGEFLSLTHMFDEITQRLYLIKHLKGKVYSM